MAWLVVDTSNTEYISKEKPVRNIAGGYWESFSYLGYHKQISFDNMIELPSNSIEKLFGKKLSFKDEPVEI